MTLEEEMALVNSMDLTAEEEADIDEAVRNAADPKDEEVALSARFDVENRLLLIELKTGQRLAVPQEDLQDLYKYDPRDLTEVEILGPGTALHFEKVMDGVEVDAVRRGIYGNERWMDGLGQRRRERLRRAS
jgi:hypothetical protein